MQIMQLHSRQGGKACMRRKLYRGITKSSILHPIRTYYQIPGIEVRVDHRSETCISIVSMMKQHAECTDGIFQRVPKVPIPWSITLISCRMAWKWIVELVTSTAFHWRSIHKANIWDWAPWLLKGSMCVFCYHLFPLDISLTSQLGYTSHKIGRLPKS